MPEIAQVAPQESPDPPAYFPQSKAFQPSTQASQSADSHQLESDVISQTLLYGFAHMQAPYPDP